MPYDSLDVKEIYDVQLKLFSDKKLILKVYDEQITTKKSDSYEPLADILPSDNESILPLIDLGNNTKDAAYQTIRTDSLARSRNLLIDLAHENYKIWSSFITLTFKENITDLDYANKCFANWVRSVKRIHSDFKYLCVPEFQRRGAVHYHLITNLSVGEGIIPKRKTIKTKSENGGYKKLDYYDLKYWKHGFSSAFDLKLTDDKFSVSLYITKYLYKDVSDRLYGRQKILHSADLNHPIFAKTTVYQVNDILKKCKLVNYYEFKKQKEFQLGYQMFEFDLDNEEFEIIKHYINNQ